ncbi:hypothetical protein DM02DRAFT_539524, partial [Periconia macrospinosa]
PRIEDKAKLPYVYNMVSETLRRCTVIPMGSPHVPQEDIQYKEYVIPKGAYILPAAWWMCHDLNVYPDPEGNEIDVSLEITPTMSARPKDFPYSVAPRSPKHAELIKDIEINHPLNVHDDAELLSV